jgi:UDP:flavonoid glycosyltransferase YjiC (YdhE family)
MRGAEFVPQTSVIPLVDLVITHGGNNTITEALHFGKPMICLPLFWDQYDNAQRVGELGLGVRLAPYTFAADELRAAIDTLLTNDDLRARLAAAGERIRARDGLRHAAGLIESAAHGLHSTRTCSSRRQGHGGGGCTSRTRPSRNVSGRSCARTSAA